MEVGIFIVVRSLPNSCKGRNDSQSKLAVHLVLFLLFYRLLFGQSRLGFRRN